MKDVALILCATALVYSAAGQDAPVAVNASKPPTAKSAACSQAKYSLRFAT